LVRYGGDAIGSLIVGEAAFQTHLERARAGSGHVERSDRSARYLELAERSLGGQPPGSSAGGEQPKFLVTRAPDEVSVLVKFSPPVRQESGARWRDLLCVEHLAHEIIERHGLPAARSELVPTEERMFLEVERFDRVSGGVSGGISRAIGRRGLISLFALSA